MACLIWPVPGFYRVSSGFRTAERPNHMGIDIGRNISPPMAIDGAVIVAAAGGRVSAAGALHDAMGNWLEVDHGGGFFSRYMHNSSNLAVLGQLVAQGEAIALVGSTGRSTAPHLHFEVVYNGRHLDPAYFLCPGRHSGVEAFPAAGVPAALPAGAPRSGFLGLFHGLPGVLARFFGFRR